jgi:Domain of unknown function (DUF4224)
MKYETNNPFFLMQTEIVELTGYKLAIKQICWLTKNGWRFHKNANGRPIVARGHASMMLGCEIRESVAKIKPNFDSLRK